MSGGPLAEPASEAPLKLVLDALFEQSPAAISLSRVTDGVIRRVNDQFCEMYGRSRVELVEAPVAVTGIWLDASARAALIERVRAEGRVRGFEFQMRRGDGAIRHVLLSVDLVDDDGEPSLLSSSVDVTPQPVADADARRMLRSEAELRASEERFRRALHDSAIGVAIFDPKGNYLEVNQALCDLLGYTREELLAKDWREVTHPDDVQSTLGVAPRARGAQATGTRFVKRYVRHDGALVWADVITSPIRDANGEITQYVTQIIDVTARKQAEDEAKQQVVAKKLVRRILRELVANAQSTTNARRELGRSLAAESASNDVESLLDAFHALNIGTLSLETSGGGRYAARGQNLLEVTPGFGSPTCHIALGYLEGLVARVEGMKTLGAEVKCQSQGHEACEFVVKTRAG